MKLNLLFPLFLVIADTKILAIDKIGINNPIQTTISKRNFFNTE